VVGQEIARQLGKKFIFAERENNRMTLRRGFSIKEGERILVCEDVVTTGGSVREVIEIVENAGAIVTGLGVIVDRSNGTVDFGVPQKSVVKMEVTAYNKDDCPLCNQNTPLVKPGSRKIPVDKK